VSSFDDINHLISLLDNYKAELTPKQKAVIATRLRDGVSVCAIAAELNIHKNTVLKTQPNFL
jgi:predicted DNA-binding protein YlxM (UPF0122 family)